MSIRQPEPAVLDDFAQASKEFAEQRITAVLRRIERQSGVAMRAIVANPRFDRRGGLSCAVGIEEFYEGILTSEYREAGTVLVHFPINGIAGRVDITTKNRNGRPGQQHFGYGIYEVARAKTQAARTNIEERINGEVEDGIFKGLTNPRGEPIWRKPKRQLGREGRRRGWWGSLRLVRG